MLVGLLALIPHLGSAPLHLLISVLEAFLPLVLLWRLQSLRARPASPLEPAQRVLKTLPCSGHKYRRAPWPGCATRREISGRKTHRKPRQSSLSDPGLSDSLLRSHEQFLGNLPAAQTRRLSPAAL